MPTRTGQVRKADYEPLESFFPAGSAAPAGPHTCLALVPEPVWSREGEGPDRVWRTTVLGRDITMVRGRHYSCDMWLLSVEDEPVCYWDERLSLARSRQHVALALDEYDRRKAGER